MIGTPRGAPWSYVRKLHLENPASVATVLSYHYTLEDFPSLNEDNNLCELDVSLSDAP